MVQDRSCLIFG